MALSFAFNDNLLPGSRSPVLISGSSSERKNIREYLVVQYNGEEEVYEIHLEHRCSPFSQIIRTDDLLAVGREDRFFIFQTRTRTLLLDLPMDGYFSSLHFEHDNFFVTDACSVYCIEKTGHVLWQNQQLGIDGVVIHDFTGNEIRGSGEWDPPGGWKDFVLNLETGKIK